MKQIEFIAPVDAMRGNLSRSKQNLLYADNDNPAWDAPEGKRSYARNYQPIFVGAKVSKNGRKYFSVKTKTAITITPAVKKRMALLGASNEVANIIMQNLQIGQRTEILYMANHPEGWSYKRWLLYYIRQGLDQLKAISFPGYESLSALHVKDPYINTMQPSDAADISDRYSAELLVKFWTQLANNPITFKVGDLTGIAHENDVFSELISSSYNVLGLTSAKVGSIGYVKLDDQWLQVKDSSDPEDEWSYVRDDNAIIDSAESTEIYQLVDDAPTA